MKFLFLVLLFPLKILAQDVTGVWTGTLYNDTTKQYLKYELAISEYDGKLSGYAHIIFVIDNTENIGVKSVKIKKSGDNYFIEDEKLIYNNYTEPAPKGVRTFSKLTLSENDTAMMLNGPWKTNETSHYRSITGNISLRKKKEIFETLIIPKLQQLGVAKSLSFMDNSNTRSNDIVINEVNTDDKTENNFSKQNNEILVKSAPIKQAEESTNKKLNNNPQVNVGSVSKDNTAKSTGTQKNIVLAKTTNELNTPPKTKPDTITLNDKTARVNAINEYNGDKKLQATTKITNDVSGNSAIMQSKAEIAKVHLPAADLDSRTIETVKSVNIKSDSLVLTLYDNGEIDGDTVSVLLNGNVIMPLQGLTAKGNSKTIYLTPEMGDSIELIMYAENLGSIPPNTGLLVVHDGNNAYEIRFSGDLQKNAAIILKRNKK